MKSVVLVSDMSRIRVHIVSLLVFKDVGKLEDAQNRLAIKQLIKEIGEPRNYGLTDEEKAEEEKKAAEERLAKEAAQTAEREHKEAMEMAEKIARWEEWVSARLGASLRPTWKCSGQLYLSSAPLKGGIRVFSWVPLPLVSMIWATDGSVGKMHQQFSGPSKATQS